MEEIITSAMSNLEQLRIERDVFESLVLDLNNRLHTANKVIANKDAELRRLSFMIRSGRR